MKNLTGINIYNIGAKNIITMNQYWSLFCKHLKKKKPLNFPRWPLYPITLFLEIFYLLCKIKKTPMLTRSRLYMFYAHNVYNVDKAQKELELDLQTDYNQLIRKTVKWWKLNGFL